MQRHRLTGVEFRTTKLIGGIVSSAFTGGELLEGLGVVELAGLWWPLSEFAVLTPAKGEQGVPAAGGPMVSAPRRAR